MKYLKSLILFLLPIAAVVGGKELFEWMGGVPDMTVVGLLLIFAIAVGIAISTGYFMNKLTNHD